MKKNNISQSCLTAFEEFNNALDDLRTYTHRANKGLISEQQTRDLIQNFENTHELALKTISSYLAQYKKGPFSGSRDLTIEAFHADLIDDGKAWLDIVIDRIQYNPIYPIDTQECFIENIKRRYMRLMERFADTMYKELNEVH